jgi:hypothetical protein
MYPALAGAAPSAAATAIAATANATGRQLPEAPAGWDAELIPRIEVAM